MHGTKKEFIEWKKKANKGSQLWRSVGRGGCAKLNEINTIKLVLTVFKSEKKQKNKNSNKNLTLI